MKHDMYAAVFILYVRDVEMKHDMQAAVFILYVRDVEIKHVMQAAVFILGVRDMFSIASVWVMKLADHLFYFWATELLKVLLPCEHMEAITDLIQ